MQIHYSISEPEMCCSCKMMNSCPNLLLIWLQDQLIPDEKLSVAFLMNIGHLAVADTLLTIYDW